MSSISRQDQQDTEYSSSSDTMNIAVYIERPSSEELKEYNRSQKYQILRSSAEKWREKIANWIESQGLSDEVHEVRTVTAFDVLFATSTPKGAKELENAPGVVGISASPEFDVDLPDPRYVG
jgi:hypothetical protein